MYSWQNKKEGNCPVSVTGLSSVPTHAQQPRQRPRKRHNVSGVNKAFFAEFHMPGLKARLMILKKKERNPKCVSQIFQHGVVLYVWAVRELFTFALCLHGSGSDCFLLSQLHRGCWKVRVVHGCQFMLTGPSAELAELSVLEGAGLCCESQWANVCSALHRLHRVFTSWAEQIFYFCWYMIAFHVVSDNNIMRSHSPRHLLLFTGCHLFLWVVPSIQCF